MDFKEIDLHVEEILGKSNLSNDIVYHYFVKIERFDCDPPLEVNSPCPSGNGKFSQPLPKMSITSKTPLVHNNHISQFLTMLKAPIQIQAEGFNWKATHRILIRIISDASSRFLYMRKRWSPRGVFGISNSHNYWYLEYVILQIYNQVITLFLSDCIYMFHKN